MHIYNFCVCVCSTRFIIKKYTGGVLDIMQPKTIFVTFCRGLSGKQISRNF
jgi:hypothetical protein